MSQIRRGGYVFVAWRGDHEPRHVHVFRDGRLVVKWELDDGRALRGRASRPLVELIRQLEAEGLL